MILAVTDGHTRILGLWKTPGFVDFGCVLGLFYLMVYQPGI